jgi:RHS repeat-associated protein
MMDNSTSEQPSQLRTNTSRLGFNGELHETAGWQILGSYRAYNPVLRRFHSPDNMSPFGRGGINAYAYGGGDPINHIDPTGHFFGAIGAAFSRVASAIGNITVNTSWSRRLATIRRQGLSGRGAPTAARQMAAEPGGALEQNIAPARPVRLPEAVLEDMPDAVMRNIVSRLEGRDLVNLAATSSRMNERVNSNLLPLDRVLDRNMITARRPGESHPYILKAQHAALGGIKGVTGGQLRRGGFTGADLTLLGITPTPPGYVNFRDVNLDGALIRGNLAQHREIIARRSWDTRRLEMLP